MTRRHSMAAAALMAISISAGCISHPERRHIYALEQAPDAPAQPGLVAGRPELQLQRVLVPDYLDTTDILLRVGAHEIRESATGRFAERLSLGITDALRSDLAARLPLVAIAPAQPARNRARQILVTVDAFDVWPTGRCVLVADWSVIDADRRSELAADRGTFTSAAVGGDSPGDAAIVSAMAASVRQLANAIASTAGARTP